MGRISEVQGIKEMVLTRQKIPFWLGVLLAIVFLSGCTTTFAKRDVSYSEVLLAQPKAEIAEAELLGVRIRPFEPGEISKEENETRGISPEIRKAEGYYSAVQLRNAMQQSGYWGPVRVVPTPVTGGEVIITGRILESDGEILRLEISVRDATGALWFTREYEEVVDESVYALMSNNAEPFRYLYNRIANDVAAYREKMVAKDAQAIRQVAELKFAEEFAPDAFKGYLVNGEPKKTEPTSFWARKTTPVETSPILKVARLPADDDVMLGRIRRIRVREEALVDTLDLQYERLAREIGAEYTEWRSSRLNEMNAVRELDRKRNQQVGQAVAVGVLGALVGAGIAAAGGRYGAGVGGAVAGTAAAVSIQMALEASNKAKADMEIHKAALEELGDSLSQDLNVTVVEIEGETVELRGTAEAKFQQWREILKDIHEREVGTFEPSVPTDTMPVDPIQDESTDSIPVLPQENGMEMERL